MFDKCVNNDLIFAGGHLYEAQVRPECWFSHELGINRDEVGFREPRAGAGKFIGVGYNAHGSPV